MRRFASAAALYLGVLALAAVSVGVFNGNGNPVAPQPEAPAAPGPDDIELITSLQPFDSCDDLLAYFRREALERVGPYGLGGAPYYTYGDVIMDNAAGAESAGAPAVAGDGSARATAGTTSDLSAGKDSYSATNVQEAGVDEPDIVKTDGNVVVAMAGERLHILGTDGGGLRRLGSLRLKEAWGSEIMLDGDRVLVLGRAQGGGGPMPMMDSARIGMPEMASPISTLRLVDISDPTSPQIVSTVTLDGDYVSARLVDGVARVVLRSQPAALPFVMPEAGGLRAERQATAKNRAVIEDSTIDQWLPYAVTTDEISGTETESSLLECDAIHHPERFAGFGMVSVLSIDLGDQLRTEGSAAVVGQAETVYASADNLYVALNDWGMNDMLEAKSPVQQQRPKTDIHQFDISDASAARYVASGSVRGRLLNQWAMSEHDGHLRVATTIDSFDGSERSESAVVILRDEDGSLEPQGRIDGLGKGEQIYAVRYDGDVGYVVTFRQTDPLYTLDLSDPQRPRALGELKVNGYSAYLHPVAEGRVLGVGQDAKSDGQVIGSQVSLFDVSDLRDPRRLDQVGLGQGSSTVEYDHRAFLFWPATGTVVLPLQTWTNKPFTGAVVLTVDGNTVRRTGQISHSSGQGGSSPGVGTKPSPPDDAYYGPEGAMITRSLVIDDALLTVSDAGVLVSGLKNLQTRDWVPFNR